MTELHKALGDIDSIRKQMASTTQFRGYGPATLASTSALAITAAIVQAKLLVDPAANISRYLTIWILTAAIVAAFSGFQMFTRARRMHSALSQEMIHMAVEQFIPALLAGTFITIVLVRYAPATAWMLPGLWQIIFSLGIFASCRFLPRAMVVPSLWYMVTGLACLSLGDDRALSSWTMGTAFGIGQLMIAAVLYFNSQESKDGD